MNGPLLEITNLRAHVGGREILRGVAVAVPRGELHVLMGPNGSGKSTLANALAGSPAVAVTAGAVRFAGADLLGQSPDERARAGLLLAFQYPVSIPGLSLVGFLTAVLQARQPQAATGRTVPRAADAATKEELPALLQQLKLPAEIASRDVNEGLSGGEKKKSEIVQLSLLRPKLAILDEPDSGLDIDALKLIAAAIDGLHRQGTAVLLITHYQRIVQYLRPNAVHVMVGGRIVRSGGPELATEIERTGYEPLDPKL